MHPQPPSPCSETASPRASASLIQDVGIQNVLIHFFDLLFPAAIAFGGVALVISLYQSLSHGWYRTALAHVGMYLFSIAVLLLRHRIPIRLIFLFFLGLMAVTAFHSFIAVGLAGEGMMTMALLCIFSGVFFGIKAGLTATGLSVISVSLVGSGVCAGLIRLPEELLARTVTPPAWSIQIFLLLLYVTPLILIVNYMWKRMFDALRDANRLNEHLTAEISAKTAMEAQLRESETKYRSIFENSVEGIFQATPDGELLCVNPALERMGRFSYPEDMVLSLENLNRGFFVHAEDRARIRSELDRHGFIRGFEVALRRRDGTTMWASINARHVYTPLNTPAMIEGSIEDISARKAAEQALHESEEKYRMIVENSLVAFFIVQDDLFRFVNSRFCTVTGYTYEDIVGKLGPSDIASAEERERLETYLVDRSMGNDSAQELEFCLKKNNGGIMTVKIMSKSLAYNQRPALSGVLIDMTHEKLLESRLLQSQKMEAIGTLTGGIAHDFNNILTALMGFGTLLHEGLNEADPLKRYADQILSVTDKAASLTRNLLTFSRLEKVALKTVDVNRAVRDTNALLERLITEDITIRMSFSEETFFILADTTQINQILINLVVNARDAMPRGGTIDIRTCVEEMDEAFIRENGFGKKGRYAQLIVSDTGVGMDAATIEKIFDPFFTTKEEGKGTGLGLSTVYGIVKQHHGYVMVQSAPAAGTTFRLYFPVTNRIIDTPPDSEVSFRKGYETILVAEDHDETRSIIGDVLTRSGYTVILAADGEDAFSKFRSHEDISLIIMDSVMPGKNGKELYDAVSTQRPGIRTLFISGYSEDIILSKGINGDHFDFIQKPLSPAKLLARVGEILDRP